MSSYSDKASLELGNVLIAVQDGVNEGELTVGEGLLITSQCQTGRLLIEVVENLDAILEKFKIIK